jgi:hypothetical protein
MEEDIIGDTLMNVFILNTGRCGSTTFIKACHHITNYTSAHESRASSIGINRLNYPSGHIEADNRLSWFLGRLEKKYGDDAFYVHLSRDLKQTAESFAKRENYGIMNAYKQGVLLGGSEEQTPYDIALDYIDTIETNIELFLKDKTNKMSFSLQTAKDDFELFWEKISAEGDLNKSLLEWDKNYNSSI